VKDKETSRLQAKLSTSQNENVQSTDKMLKLEAVTLKLTEELNGFKTESENDWNAISTLQNYNATLNTVNSDLESKIENLTTALEQKETDILSLRSKCENIFHETSKSDH
jgi:chromosome segregation ATPase